MIPTATVTDRFRSPKSYTPKHLAAKILTSKRALEGERKQVTVLFADIRGSMELLVDRDPEEARQILDPVLERMVEAVHRYEGIVNQVMGDGVMALFGAPLANEDHAVRACYAALRMQDSIGQYAEEARRRYGIDVKIRAGLNSGDVVVRTIGSDLDMDYTAVGQTTHLAGRMEQLASPGSILATATTLRLAEGYVETKALGPMPVKGLASPVEVYEVIGATAAKSRLDAALGRGLTEFVGRQSELNRLSEALERAEAGHGQVVAVVGEAGVGKSRLYRQFLQLARSDRLKVLTTSGVSFGRSTPYLAISDLLKTVFNLEARDDARAIRSKITSRLFALDSALHTTLPAFLSLLDVPTGEATWDRLDPVERRRLAREAIKALLRRESLTKPVVLIVEDLQWIDSETQSVLDSLVEHLPSTRLLLLVNYRPEYEHPWARKSFYHQIPLGVLTPNDTSTFLDVLLGGDSNLGDLKRFLRVRTEGNPFFIEESVRALVETGSLSGAMGAYRVTTDRLTAAEIPATVQAVLAARIDRLSPDEKSLLLAASAVGKNVPLKLLQEIVHLPQEVVQRRLERLQAAELLYEAKIHPDLEYSFTHALTHEAAYASLLHDQRRSLHAEIVNAIERLYPERPAEYVEQLAYHAYSAELWERAAAYLRQAGGKALACSAYREAATCYRTALLALERLGTGARPVALGVDLRLELRTALLALGENREILDKLSEAERLASSIGDVSRLAWIYGYRCMSHWGLGELGEALLAGERALDCAQKLADDRLRSLARLGLGWTYHGRGEYRESLEELSSLMREIRPLPHLTLKQGSPLVAVVALSWAAACQTELGEFEAGVTSGAEAVRLAEEFDQPWSRAAAYYALGVLHLRRGDLESSLDVLERGLRLCEDYEMWNWFTGLASAVGYAKALAGQPERGRDLLQQAVERAETIQSVFRQSLRVAWLAEAEWLAARRDRGRSLAERALDLAQSHGERGHRVHILRLLGELALDVNDDGRAEGYFNAAISGARQLFMRPLEAQSRLGLGRLNLWRHDVAKADENLNHAVTMFNSLNMPAWAARARNVLLGAKR